MYEVLDNKGYCIYSLVCLFLSRRWAALSLLSLPLIHASLDLCIFAPISFFFIFTFLLKSRIIYVILVGDSLHSFTGHSTFRFSQHLSFAYIFFLYIFSVLCTYTFSFTYFTYFSFNSLFIRIAESSSDPLVVLGHRGNVMR